LQGAEVLVVEDDFLISMQVSAVLADAGAQVVGPARSVEAALSLIDRESISAAVLDIRVGATTAADVARRLHARNIPFVFYTGQLASDTFRSEWPDCQFISKPAQATVIVAVLAGLLKREAAPVSPAPASDIKSDAHL
jgi:DNA-binding NtrC family response regulator